MTRTLDVHHGPADLAEQRGRAAGVFLTACLAVPVAVLALTVGPAPGRVVITALLFALTLPLLLAATALLLDGRRAVQLLLFLTWGSTLPVLAWLSPPIAYHHSFDAGASPSGQGVTILVAQGWTLHPDGLALDPGRQGTLLLRLPPPPWLRALSLQAHIYRQWAPVPFFPNRLELSSDGATYRPLGTDLHLAGSVLPLPGQGRHPLLLRLTASNPSAAQVLVVDDVRVTTSYLRPSVLVAFTLLGLLFAWRAPSFARFARVASAADACARRALTAAHALVAAGSRHRSGVAVVGLTGLLVFAIPLVRPGPDFGAYADYIRLFAQGDLVERGVLKVSEASIGPAAVWEPFRRLFALLRFPDELARDMYYAALANWLAFAALLVSQMRFLERRGLRAGSIALAIGVTYFGTPLIYYGLFSVASEMLAALSVWLVFRRLASGEPETPTAWLALGGLCGLAVLVRTNTAVFVAIMLLPLAVSRLRRRPWPVSTLHLGLLAAGALAGMLPALILNTVFLGAPLRTLYSFRLASGEFLMLDFAHPKLTEVLLSHWHGLLVYSPIYLLAAGGAALALARDLRGRRDQPPGTRRRWHRPLDDPLPYLVGVYAVTYLYLASAWRPWWMGTGTFGGRQFITLAPFATLSVASVLQRVEGTRWCLPVTASSLLCGIWTLLLALQRDTNFTVSYAQLWEAQLTVVTHHLGLDILPLAAASLTVLFAHAVWHRTGAPSAAALCLVAALVWGTTLLLALVAGYLPLIRPPGTGAFLAVSLALALGVAVLCRVSFHPAPASWLRPLAVTGFLAITAIPVWTGASTLVRLQRGETPVRRDFRTAHLLALTDSLQEYGRIAGYERDRAAWRRLVDEFARTTAALPPDPAGAPARPRP